jgi:CPA2 family monovalent cation:H+ antiporter-2
MLRLGMDAARTFLQDLALVCCASAVVTVLFRRLGQPVVLGYLLAGILIGPHVAIPLVADSEHIHDLSELGVILVMFSIGLELSVARLLRVLPTTGVIGALEIGGMIWLGYSAGALLGWSWKECLFAGAMLSISSTVIVARVFAEQKVERRVTSLAFGILVVEDLAAVLLLAVLTALGTGQSISAGSLVETTGRLALFLIALLIVGFLVVPRAIRAISRLGSPETLLVASMGLCFGLALLAHTLGYSVALGAFLAGSLIAESGRHRQVAHLIAPLRDFFAAVFFVSVGMMVDPAVILAEWPVILLLTGIVIGGKIVFVSLGSFVSGMDLRRSIHAGMSLTQIGEFSFIMASVGVASGAAGSFLYPVAVAVAVITTFTTPWLVRASDPVSRAVERRLPAPVRTFVTLYEGWLAALRARLAGGQASAHAAKIRRWAVMLVLDAAVVAAIVVVASVAWPVLAGLVQRHAGAPPLLGGAVIVALALVLALPFARGVLRRARNLGVALAEAVVVPNSGAQAGRLDLGATPRRALVLSLQLGIVVLVGVPFLAVIQPFIPLLYVLPVLLAVVIAFGVVLWRSTTDLAGHVQAGAELVLEVLGRQRGHDEPSAGEQIDRLLPGLGPMAELRVGSHSPAAGLTLAELDLRGRTGAIVLAIVRGEQGIVNPTGREALAAGDLLALFGTEDAIAAATALLGDADQSSNQSANQSSVSSGRLA